MSKFLFIVFAVLVAAIIGGGAYLATFDPPISRERVEQVLPNDRFPE